MTRWERLAYELALFIWLAAWALVVLAWTAIAVKLGLEVIT